VTAAPVDRAPEPAGEHAEQRGDGAEEEHGRDSELDRVRDAVDRQDVSGHRRG
jgi:hypothetical protein